MEDTNSHGTPFRTRAGDALTHVAMHGSYHRGQIASAVRRAGAEPVDTASVTYVRELGRACRDGCSRLDEIPPTTSEPERSKSRHSQIACITAPEIDATLQDLDHETSILCQSLMMERS